MNKPHLNERCTPLCEQILSEVAKQFLGNDDAIRKVLYVLLAGGHILLEDMPGVGKTTLATAFSKTLDLSYNRVQFTPDVMPSDVTGYTMLHQDTRAMEYRPGAVMCNFLLADEINRASARSQSALLEAMEENAVTVDGHTHILPNPFMVIATQNPSGSSGTQLLPDSQTDRFMMRISIGYPDEDAELDMLLRKHGDHAPDPIVRLTNADSLVAMRRETSQIYVAKAIYKYIMSLIRSTRTHAAIERGASPRCSVALTALSQAAAYVTGRDFVIPEDVQSVYLDCVAHRLVMSAQAKRDRATPQSVLAEILANTATPKPRMG